MRFRNWLPALLWMALIFLMSSSSQLPSVDEGGVLDWSWRQLGHVGEFLLLSLLITRGLRGGPWAFPALVVVASALAAGYGGLDELHQHFVPDRNGNLEDLVCDAFGAALGGLWVWRSPKLRRWLVGME